MQAAQTPCRYSEVPEVCVQAGWSLFFSCVSTTPRTSWRTPPSTAPPSSSTAL